MHRTALRSDGAHTTTLINIFTGRPARSIVNRIMRELGPMNPNAPKFQLATAASLSLRQKAESMGSGDFSPLWAGQNITGCKEIGAELLTQELVGLI